MIFAKTKNVLGYGLTGRAADFDSVSGGSNPSILKSFKFYFNFLAGAHSFNWQNGGLLIRDFGFKSQCAHPALRFNFFFAFCKKARVL